MHTDATGNSMEAIYSGSDLMLVGRQDTMDSMSFSLFLLSLFLPGLLSNSARFSLVKIQKIYSCIHLFTKDNRCTNISVPGIFFFFFGSLHTKSELVKLSKCKVISTIFAWCLFSSDVQLQVGSLNVILLPFRSSGSLYVKNLTKHFHFTASICQS